MNNINELLKEKRIDYGSFLLQAKLSQNMKSLVWYHNGWDRLSHPQRESIEMILHKISRIVNGNPDIIDSWKDIAGYAMLVVNDLENLQKSKYND